MVKSDVYDSNTGIILHVTPFGTTSMTRDESDLVKRLLTEDNVQQCGYDCAG